jgi:hypothetical protein
MVKHVEALVAKMSDGKSADAKKNDARTSDKFMAAITEEADADGELAKLYALREAAAAAIEMYRTESATFRHMKI